MITVLGAWCGLDRTAFGQTLLAHPMIAASLSGALAGDFGAGLWAGITLMAVSAPVLPVGERSIRDWTSAAVVLGAVAASTDEPSVRGAALVAVLGLAWVGGRLIHRVRARAAQVLARRRSRPATEHLQGLEREHLSLSLLHGLRGGLVVGASTGILLYLLPALVDALASSERRALAGLWKVAPLAALPLLLRFHAEPGRLWPYLALGALAGLLILWAGGGVAIGALGAPGTVDP